MDSYVEAMSTRILVAIVSEAGNRAGALSDSARSAGGGGALGVGSIAEMIAQYGVPIVALLVLLGQLGIPTGVSAEAAILLAGCYAVHSLGELIGAVALLAAADLIGAAILFLAVRRGSARFLARRRGGGHRGRRSVSYLLFAGRFLPFVRMPATVALAMTRVPTRRFLGGSAVAALVWCGVPLGVGYLLRSDVRAVIDGLGTVSQALLWLLPAAGLPLAWFLRRMRRPAAPAVLRVPARPLPPRPRAVYGVAPVAVDGSGWLLRSVHEPVNRRTIW
jgi:membrane protein DedA with SNARE-associated domain